MKQYDFVNQSEFELVEDESIIFEEMATYHKSTLNEYTCIVRLTNYRFILCDKSFVTGMALFGIAGAAYSLLRKQTKITFQFPLNEIQRVEIKKHFLIKKFRFVIKDGRNFEVSVQKHKKWLEKFKDLEIEFLDV